MVLKSKYDAKSQQLIKSPLKSIRTKCIDCVGTAAEVRKCTEPLLGRADGQCELRPYRFGKRPPGYKTPDEPEGIIRPPTRAIRKYCLWCCCGSALEVRLCSVTSCALWAFRFGKKPHVSEKDEKMPRTPSPRSTRSPKKAAVAWCQRSLWT